MGLRSKKNEKAEAETASEVRAETVARDADFSKLDADSDSTESSDAKAAEAAAKPAEDSGEITKLKAEAADLKDKYLRSLAEFENFRKRSMKERSELIKYQGEPILVEILEVLDGFERALEHTESDPAKLNEGIKLIHKQFVDVLGKWDVRADTSLGKEFDPFKHRAIAKAKMEGKKANTIVGELKKAYLYKDKLLRVGEVVVAEGDAPVGKEDVKEGEDEKDGENKDQLVQ